MLRSGIGGCHHVLFLEAHATERARPHGERLRRRIPFGWHIPFWDSTLLDWNDWLAIHTIEDKEITGLTDMGNGRYSTAILHDIEETAGSRHIGIPDVVMDRLKVPEIFAGLCVDSDDRIGELVAAGPIATVVVSGWP